MSDEFDPFVIYRVAGETMDCALWPLEDGGKALTLFLTREAALAYLQTAGLAAEWKVYQPPQTELFKMLRRCHASGILYAVLDPNSEQSARLFDIAQVLAAGG